MINQTMLEEMFRLASASGSDDGERWAGVCRRLLDMPENSTVTVQFEAGEDFVITRRSQGYTIQ